MKNTYIIKDTKNNLVFNEEFTIFAVKFPTEYTNKKIAIQKLQFAKRFIISEDASLVVLKIR